MTLFARKNVLPLLLCFSLSGIPALANARADDVLPENIVNQAACPMTFLDEEAQYKLIGDSIADLKKDMNGYRRVMAGFYAVKIRNRVLKVCSKKEMCTREDVLRAIVDETEKFFGRMHKTRGMFIMATLYIGGFLLSKPISKATGGVNPIVAVFIGQQISNYLNKFKKPLLDRTIDKKLDQWIAAMTRETTEKGMRAENPGFKAAYENMKATFTGDEFDGRNSLLGSRADMIRNVTTLQNYLLMDASSTGMVKASDDDYARMLASLLFQAHIFHADIRPDDPHMLAIFGPIVRPLAPLYQKLKGKVWAEINRLETEEAVAAGEEVYDKGKAQRFYDELVKAWFPPDPPAIKPIDKL